MPLDCDNVIDQHLITDAVHPSKDVDGFVIINFILFLIDVINYIFIKLKYNK